MEHDEVRARAALDRLADLTLDDEAAEQELDAAVHAAFRTPGVSDELLRRADRLAQRRREGDDEPAA